MSITKLKVFDFDGTLMDTGEPESHKVIWKQKTGTDWPHIGWWGRKESLDMSVFTFLPKPEVREAYEEILGDEEVMRIMLTGRRPKLKDEVKAILDANDFTFDKYLYNYGSDTLTNKITQVNEVLTNNPSINSVEMWDDRDEHIPSFIAWGEDLISAGTIKEFKMNHIHNPNWTK